jgi:hypothetical protein
MKRQYSFRVVSDRPAFPQTITENEAKILLEHAAYWRTLDAFCDKGPHPQQEAYALTAILFADEDDLPSIVANDPITRANIGLRIEHRYWPMQKMRQSKPDV